MSRVFHGFLAEEEEFLADLADCAEEESFHFAQRVFITENMEKTQRITELIK